MRVLIGLLMLTLSMTANAQVPFPPTDKTAHFGMSYVITDMMLHAGYSKKRTFWTILGLSLLKEAYDHRVEPNTAEHWNDMAFNAAGSASAMLVFEWKIEPKKIW